MKRPKTIYCPLCGLKAMEYSGEGTMNLTHRCKKCGKIVVYSPEEDKTTYHNIPDRTQSSGMRFW
jgi:uncharacterized Zn finger protein